MSEPDPATSPFPGRWIALAAGSRGVVNAAGGGDEVVTLTGNVFRNLTTAS